MTGGQKHQDTVPLAHVECVVDLAPSAPQRLTVLLLLTMVSEHDLLLSQPFLFGNKMEPGGCELFGSLLRDGG